jgi:hypothetical protein
MSRHGFFSLFLFVVSSPVALGETFTVTIQAVDSHRMPVARADVSLFWNGDEHGMVPMANKSAVTDALGKAVLRVDDWNEERPILVLSADRKLGGIVGVSKADDGKEVPVTLTATVRIRGKLECKELNKRLDWANTLVFMDGFRAYFTQHISKNSAFEFVLPAGKYKFSSYGSDVQQANQTVELSADQPERDLGVIDLKASPIAKLRGKAAPEWIIADARGAKTDVKIGDQKGKWVYLEFWGYW